MAQSRSFPNSPHALCSRSVQHIVLISCVKTKRNAPAKAKDLYVSNLFRKWWAFALTLRPDHIYILSALHGLVDPEREIEPYQKTLNTMPIADVRRWAGNVIESLERIANLQTDRFTFLCGERYRRYLTPHLHHVDVPLEGLGNGKQLAFLKQALQR